MKRILLILMSCLLVIPTFLVSATSDTSNEEDSPSGEGIYSEKHEVVYATLQATGEQDGMYIVNNFNIEEPGKITDYGEYTTVKNLTDLTEITQNEQQVEFTAKDEQFFYQGDLNGKPLPWDIDINYSLNGESLSADELLGNDGKLQIDIDTTQNDEADTIFYNNYLLQISVPLDSEIYQNIETDEGIVANAGKNKQVTFTVMPEKDGNFTIEADVKNLELESFEITAMPSTMSVDSPDSDDMTEDMESLSDATAEVNDGLKELKGGISDLNDGVSELENGSGDYQTGIHDLDGGSAELIEGSGSIDQALEEMSQSLNQGESFDTSELRELQEGLLQIASGLEETEEGLTELKDGYEEAYNALDDSMQGIPEGDLSEEELAEVVQNNPESEAVQKLVETYEAAQVAKGTYAQVNDAFQQVSPTLDQVIGSLEEMRTNLETMASELDTSLNEMDSNGSLNELQEGLDQLSTEYKTFHSGLVDYTNGVSELSNSYDGLHNGITDLSSGTSELENGAAELHDGTTELMESTSDLPEEMQNEIDNMINEYDKSDFEPVSFVSPKNEKVETVQFVIKTESIKHDDEDEEEPEEEEPKGFWEKLMDLFR
ncbi:YhgE/Pip domain-containing protein [Aquisalibacillus elongatus]|nr:YhgE/Pip domain-containing protein [Aquisalibacillus elongatus]